MKKSTPVFAVALLALTGYSVRGSNPDQEELNKEIAMDFYDKAINQKDFEAASKHLGPRYIQHNPLAADGAAGLKNFLEYARANIPNFHTEVKRVFADGDFVILHVHAKSDPAARGSAVVDIFRLENGKVVEHWDVIQEIPEQAANTNGMF